MVIFWLEPIKISVDHQYTSRSSRAGTEEESRSVIVLQQAASMSTQFLTASLGIRETKDRYDFKLKHTKRSILQFISDCTPSRQPP